MSQIKKNTKVAKKRWKNFSEKNFNSMGLYLLMVIGAGLEFAFLKKAMYGISPITAGVFLFPVTVVLLFLTTLTGKEISVDPRGNFTWLLAVGLVGFLCNILWISGAKYTTVTNASVLSKMDIFFTFILSILFFHEKIRKIAIVAVPVMLAGAFFLTQQNIGSFCFGEVGDYLMISYAFFLSLNAFIIKRCMKKSGGISTALYNCLINFILFLVLFFIFESPSEVFSFLPSSAWFYLISCGACGYMFFVGYYGSLKRLPVWEVRLLTLAIPVVATGAGWLMGERIFNSFVQLAGGMMILLGSALIIISDNMEKKKMEHLPCGCSYCPKMHEKTI